MIAVVRMDQPAGAPRPQVDAAHSQKRAFEVALASVLAQRIVGGNAKVELRSVGRDRHVPVANGEADLAVTPLVIGAAGITYSQPFAAGGTVLVVKTSGATRLDELARKTIGTSPGELDAAGLAQEYLTARNVTATLKTYESFRLAMEGLDKGEVDAVTGDRAGAQILSREKPNAYRILADVASRPYAVTVRLNATALLARVNEVLKELMAAGEIKKLADAAGFPYEAPAP